MVQICPNCGRQTNSSHTRLVKDNCGHEKCRICLLYEEYGCKACEESASYPGPSGLEVRLVPAVPLDFTPKHLSPPDPASPLAKEDESAPEAATSRKKPPDRSHILTLPGEPERYKCTLCLKVFRNKKGKCYHDVCVTGVNPYHCTICDRTFVKKSHFEYHERVHTGYRPFQCHLCPKAFPQRNKLNRHMLSHSQEKKFLCPTCGKRYSKNDDLKTHMMNHTGSSAVHVCPTCGKSFRARTSLNRHMHTHSSDRPHACDDCGKGFKDRSLLVRHKRTHGKERPFCCNECQRVFISKSELRRHMSTHSSVKPFACSLCGTDFRRKDNLNRHIRYHHDPNSPSSVKDPKERAEKTETAKRSTQRERKRSKVDVGPRATQISNTTPVIRAPGELSNAVPVIRRPEEQKRPVLQYTEPIPIAEVAVINQRIEEKLYPSNANSSCFFRERSCRDSHISVSILPPLRHNSAVKAVPTSSRGRRLSDSNFSPPKNGILTELKSSGVVLADREAQIEENRRKCTIVTDERVSVSIGESDKAEGTNCVSTIKKNWSFERSSEGRGSEARGKIYQVHWRRRTSENLKPYLK